MEGLSHISAFNHYFLTMVVLITMVLISRTIVAGTKYSSILVIVIFGLTMGALLVKSGMAAPGLSEFPAIVLVSQTTIIALIAVLIHRLYDPVLRMLSEFNDYLVWFVTILPLITGWLAFHRVGLTGPAMIALHILSVELLMVLFPFTKLSHAFTLWMARWYNGAIAGYKGVQS